uniref:RING-type domain-containing protein n=1 Tax=Quercus lobata TaxID=97700 RepID=A0A7N2LGX0_QUELO
MSTSNLPSSSGTTDDISGSTIGIVFSIGIFLLILLITFVCIWNRLPHNQSTHPIPITSLRTSDLNSITILEQGLDEATLNSYPKLVYSQIKGTSPASCCSICLVDYKETDMLRLLPHCSHLFHQNCIDPWIRLHPTCPVCRKAPASSSPTYNYCRGGPFGNNDKDTG